MFALLLLAQTTIVPLPAPIVPTPEQADARCVAAFGAMATSEGADAQRAAQMGALYFYGKLVGRKPAIDLRAAMTQASGAVGADLKVELTRCGTELQRAGLAMQAAGEAMARDTGAGSRSGVTPTPAPKPTPKTRR